MTPRATVTLRAALAAIALLGGSLLGAGASRAAEPDSARVLVLRLDGPISPVSDEALARALDRAKRGGHAALVLEIDTPGGLESSMRAMIKRILAAPVPVIAWVAPSGARAGSAGVLIVMASDVAAMAPGTNIGAATPVNMQGPMDSTLARKAVNDAAAFARTVATQRGRSVAWAEDAVRRAVAASEDEAVELDVVDFVAASLPELLEKADGRSWRRQGEARTIAVRGLPIERIEAGPRQRLLALIAEPNIAYLLMMLGFYGVLFELQNPGAILPGVVGGICLILAFLALSVMSFNVAGLALIVLSLVFFVAEIKVQSHGVLAAGGIVALVLGSVIMFNGGPGPQLSWGVIAGATFVTSAFFLIVIAAAVRAQRRRVSTGIPGLLGRRAVVIERLAPRGRVRLGDEYWNAVSSEPVEAGADVEVIGVDGLLLRVRASSQEA
jgi:membrane-bound serine protease (ClpP class)